MMSVKRLAAWRRLLSVLAFIVVLGAAPLGWAADQGAASNQSEVHEDAGDAGHHDEAALKDLLARGINFALLVLILAVVLKKSNAFGFFSSRAEEIKRKMERLEEEKEQAEVKYLEIKKKLEAFEAEKESILDEARREGEVEKKKIIAEAEGRVAHMMEQMEATIIQEVQEAKARLKQEVADMAAAKARGIIEKELNESDQERLVTEFIKRVGEGVH
ncbi:MAG: hypothetical protein ACLFUE_09995 [Desulfobacteraceae bacterium]